MTVLGIMYNLNILVYKRLIGIGINGRNQFYAFMYLPKHVFQRIYHQIVKIYITDTEAIKFKSVRKAVDEEK